MQQIPQLFIAGISLGATYALVGLAFFSIYSGTRLFNFALGEYVVLGMFFMYTFQGLLGLPSVLALLATVIVVALLSALFERAFIYPARDQGLLVLINITVGGAFVIRTLVLIIWGREIHLVSPLISGQTIELLGARIQPQIIIILVVVTLALAIAYYVFSRTWWGQSIVVTALNKQGAQVIGINTPRVSTYVWLISGVFSGLAGALLAPVVFAEFTRGFRYMLSAFASAMLGGVGHPAGAVIGGLLLGLIEMFGGFYISSRFREIIVSVIILLVLMFRPQGILSRRGAKAIGLRD